MAGYLRILSTLLLFVIGANDAEAQQTGKVKVSVKVAVSDEDALKANEGFHLQMTPRGHFCGVQGGRVPEESLRNVLRMLKEEDKKVLIQVAFQEESKTSLEALCAGLDTLRRAAIDLDCEVVIILVMRSLAQKPIDK